MKTSPVPSSRDRAGSTQRTLLFTAAGVALFGVFATVSLVAQDATNSAPLLPGEVPSELQEALKPLDNNWQAWSDSVAQDLANLYAPDQQDPAKMRANVDVLKRRLTVVEKALDDPSYRSIEVPLRNLQGQLARRVSVLEAALDTLELPPEARTARLEQLSSSVSTALTALTDHLKKVNNGEGWLTYVNADKVQSALDAGEAETVPVLQDLGKRFAAAENNDDAVVRDYINGPKFQALKKAAANYVAFATRENSSANGPATQEQLASLIQGLEAYEAQPGSAAAAQVRDAFAALRNSTIDGGARLESALRANYFNYNFRVVVSEDFINKFVRENRQERGPVRDFILGARVSGNQVTATDVSFDLKPDARNARFEIKLAGIVNSSTQGVTDQATIFTNGTHYFWANKPVIFNGDTFTTEPARIAVNANNRTVGAETNFSGFPILGGLADGIAVGEAQKKKPQSEAIARQRVSSRVLPKFNEEVNAEFATANVDVQTKLDDPLKELGLYPDAKTFQTSENDITIQARLMAPGELGASSQFHPQPPAKGARVQLHESWMNNSIDRMELAGKTINEDELKALFESRLKKLLGEDFKFPEPKKTDEYEEDEGGPAVLVFADKDPIRVQVQDNMLVIRLMSGIQRDDDDDIPTQEITIKLKFTIDGDTILVERDGAISVLPVDKPDSRLQQLAFASAMRGIFERATPPRTLERTHDVKYKERTVKLNVKDVDAMDGWLTIDVE